MSGLLIDIIYVYFQSNCGQVWVYAIQTVTPSAVLHDTVQVNNN